MTKQELDQLQIVLDAFTTEDYFVVAIPKKIQTAEGKLADVIDTSLYHKPTKTKVDFLYRDAPSNYRKTLQKAFDQLEGQVLAKAFDKPDKNSL